MGDGGCWSQGPSGVALTVQTLPRAAWLRQGLAWSRGVGGCVVREGAGVGWGVQLALGADGAGRSPSGFAQFPAPLGKCS
ncbi:hypothetical protein GCM10009760_46880 [Kitasatospora kazusensis]|uniref:Uncharacterized protein n=1 Tax=Kitasatospora kazusensis TaxID=407974 RepID=A0ABN3A1G1_9ACTN